MSNTEDKKGRSPSNYQLLRDKLENIDLE
jgi:hypothetical protein